MIESELRVRVRARRLTAISCQLSAITITITIRRQQRISSLRYLCSLGGALVVPCAVPAKSPGLVPTRPWTGNGHVLHRWENGGSRGRHCSAISALSVVLCRSVCRAPLKAAAGGPVDDLAVQHHCPAGRKDQPAQHPERRCLPGPVGSEQPKDLAGMDLEADESTATRSPMSGRGPAPPARGDPLTTATAGGGRVLRL